MTRVARSGACKPRQHTLVLMLGVLVVFLLLYSALPQLFFAQQRELPVRDRSRTVVSISSFSQRVFQMRGCLDSIFAQSQPADRVIVTIPRTFRALEQTTSWGWFFDLCGDTP